MLAGQAGIGLEEKDWTALLHGIDVIAELLFFSIVFGFYFLHPSLTMLSFLNPGVINDTVSEFLPDCNFIFLISAPQTFSQLFLKLSNYLWSLSQVYAVGPCQCGASRLWHTWDKLQRQ